ncbi:hypothetical protein [Undibacter mobilis]|uniref:Uncharacterized protein n=1 Tax=Undibacter mobilis TaxID=2292256 RepID=A0A371BC53_9BRAD|nr:hypothetical protein [Undibacter mobilis]RDV04931.1 hypothetical protein DXH78_10375 [Undibacter mobilis]
MTDASIGIRGISPFAGTPQGRRQLPERGGERSLAKHAAVTDDDNEAQEPLSLDPGRLIDITV